MHPAKFFQLKAMWDRFAASHPKFPRFLAAAAESSFREGSVIEIKIIHPNGDEIASNLKLTAEDLEMFAALRAMTKE